MKDNKDIKIDCSDPKFQKLLREFEQFLLVGYQAAPINLQYLSNCGFDYDAEKEEFDYYIDNPDDSDKTRGFREFLLEMIQRKDIDSNSTVYRRSNVSKTVFSRCTSFVRCMRPTKNTVAAFCIGLGLDISEAEEMYNIAGYNLGKETKFDRGMRYVIDKKIYDIHAVNALFYSKDITILGTRRTVNDDNCPDDYDDDYDDNMDKDSMFKNC